MEHVLWTEKYSPKNPDEMVGCRKTISDIRDWLGSWKRGTALLLHGPTGTGKGLSIELVAREMGFHLVRLDASENRKSANMASVMSESKNIPLFYKGKLILIDEVDSISGRERGAVAAIKKLINESASPVVLIANDAWKPKIRPLKACCRLVRFTRVPAPSIAKRLADICSLEKINAGEDVLKSLARWSQGDMRSAITDLHIISHGKTEISGKDLDALGYRERQNSVLNIMPTILHSGSINAARKAIYSSNTDPDEVFWWVETNLHTELAYREPNDKTKEAYELLSKADILRNAVHVRQNWRLKGFMVDLLSGVSLFTNPNKHGYTAYKPPQRFIELGKSKFRRALVKSLCRKISNVTHTSSKRAKRDILPFLKQMGNKDAVAECFGLTEEEAGFLVK